jgi:hypothetical protein
LPMMAFVTSPLSVMAMYFVGRPWTSDTCVKVRTDQSASRRARRWERRVRPKTNLAPGVPDGARRRNLQTCTCNTAS